MTLCLLHRYCIVQHNEDRYVSVCLPGNGQCSPGEVNSRMLADMSTPNGQTVPQGPNSPSGECSIKRYTFLQSARSSYPTHTHTHTHRNRQALLYICCCNSLDKFIPIIVFFFFCLYAIFDTFTIKDFCGREGYFISSEPVEGVSHETDGGCIKSGFVESSRWTWQMWAD